MITLEMDALGFSYPLRDGLNPPGVTKENHLYPCSRLYNKWVDFPAWQQEPGGVEKDPREVFASLASSKATGRSPGAPGKLLAPEGLLAVLHGTRETHCRNTATLRPVSLTKSPAFLPLLFLLKCFSRGRALVLAR